MKKIDGIWRFKKSNRFFTYFWGWNLYRYLQSIKWFSHIFLFPDSFCNYFHTEYPKNKCQLFQGMFGVPWVLLAILLINAFKIGLIIAFGFCATGIGLYLYDLFTSFSMGSIVLPWGYIGWCFLVVCGIAALIYLYYFLYYTNAGILFREYLRDKKSGLCSMVVFDD